MICAFAVNEDNGYPGPDVPELLQRFCKDFRELRGYGQFFDRRIIRSLKDLRVDMPEDQGRKPAEGDIAVGCVKGIFQFSANEDDLAVRKKEPGEPEADPPGGEDRRSAAAIRSIVDSVR